MTVDARHDLLIHLQREEKLVKSASSAIQRSKVKGGVSLIIANIGMKISKYVVLNFVHFAFDNSIFDIPCEL